MTPELTPHEAESLRSGWLPPSAVPKVSPAMRRYYGIGTAAAASDEPVPYSLTPAAEAALPGTREIEAAFRSAEENYFRSPGTAGRLLADCEIDGPEAAYELAAEVLDEWDSADSAAYQDLEAEGDSPEPEAEP